MNDHSHAIMALIEYQKRPTALGWFRKVDRAGFHLQQLPLNELEFAMLMSDFFVTFKVCSKHDDEARYFPAISARWFKADAYCSLTVAMLCEAASLGRWPEED